MTSRTSTTSATALGLMSIGIGVTELAAPRQIQNLMGIPDRYNQRAILRILGIREICHGLGILTAKNRRTTRAAVSSRLLGDVLDTAVLGAVAPQTKAPASFAAVSAAVLGIGIMDMLCAKKLSASRS